jgi:predicted glycogen debranching enzyme
MTYLDQGMVPNCFDERGGKPLYNSIDASLWFIIAAERYARQADRQGDLAAQAFWREQLLPACRSIMRRYADGTRFDIHADSDHLLTGGSIDTQLTWMDAKLGQEVITSRYGKAVEINALWHSAHGILARRMRSIDQHQAESYAQLADKIAESFRQTFWNDRFGWLNDVVNDRGVDASLRPNQLLAVSLPYSPLRGDQQRAVVDVCREKLLTPFGLRTLSPDDPRYRRRYGGCSESRERAYHQGTVWAWLIGPFIEAWLKTAENPDDAVTQARSWLAAFDGHLNRAGLGQISEIFDGHEPHTPRGCFAQAWSIAEVLRAKQLVEEAAEK